MKGMKHAGFLLLPMLLLIWQGCDTVANVEDPDLHYFVKYYGGDGNQFGVDMLALDDGGFLLLGKDSVSVDVRNVYLVRVDAQGDVVWEQQINDGAGKLWDAKDLERTTDGNFVVLADVRSGIGGDSNVKLFKISPDGVVLASAEYGTVANDYSRTVTTGLLDGGYLITGYTELTATFNLSGEPDPDLGDAFNVRLDDNLQPVPNWGPVILGFGSNLDVAVKGFQRPDTTYYIFGYTNSTLSGNLNPNKRLGLFYFQRDSSGTQGNVFYPGNIVNVNDTRINYVGSMPANFGGGVIVIGTSINNVGQSEFFLAKMRNSLTFVSADNDATYYNIVPLGRNIRGVSACQSTTGEFGYLLLGNEVRTTQATNLWLSKVNQNGNVLWSTTLGSEAEADTGAAVMQLPDGKIVVLGTMGLADNQYKMAFIKLNPQGQFLK